MFNIFCKVGVLSCCALRYYLNMKIKFKYKVNLFCISLNNFDLT